MLDFFRGSFRELKHVVWPTRGETKKYFFVVTTILLCFGFYLFLADTLFSKVLYDIKGSMYESSSNHIDPMLEPEPTLFNSGSVEGSGTSVQ